MSKNNTCTLLTGGRPTGRLHLGHYFGAFKLFADIQEQYSSRFCLMSDMHMLTTAATHKAIKAIWDNSINMVIDVIAMGADPNSTIFYLQSNIPEMPYLYTLIQNFISVDEINSIPSLLRTIEEMKVNANMDSISMGLLAYPVMESADVILMRADMTTVGRDNIDHIKIAQSIISSMNKESTTALQGVEWCTSDHNYLPGLDGKAKMSKSLDNCIYIRDSIDSVRKKIDNAPWVSNKNNVILTYLHALEPLVFEQESSRGIDYSREAYYKGVLLDVLESFLLRCRSRAIDFIEDRRLAEDLLITGTQTARERAQESLEGIKVGLGYDVQHCLLHI